MSEDVSNLGKYSRIYKIWILLVGSNDIIDSKLYSNSSNSFCFSVISINIDVVTTQIEDYHYNHNCIVQDLDLRPKVPLLFNKLCIYTYFLFRSI